MRNVIIKSALVAAGLAFSVNLFAYPPAKYPLGCHKMGYSFKHHMLILHPHLEGNSQSIYFIHDKAGRSVTLHHMANGDQPYIMNLNNRIFSKQWGVFATDEQEMRFACTVPNHKSKYGKIVDCKKVLELCEYPNVIFAPNNHGNYWVVQSSSRKGAHFDANRRQGILLR